MKAFLDRIRKVPSEPPPNFSKSCDAGDDDFYMVNAESIHIPTMNSGFVVN